MLCAPSSPNVEAGGPHRLKGINRAGKSLANGGWRLSGRRRAGHRIQPELGFWCGAPRRNRTGDPILTMEPPGTAVRTAIPAGHARPSEPKLSVLLRRSYALTFKPCADRLAGVVATPVESPVDHPRDAAAGQLEHRCHRQGCPGHRRSRLWWPGQHPLCFSHCRISRSIPHHGRIAPDRSVSRPSAR